MMIKTDTAITKFRDAASIEVNFMPNRGISKNPAARGPRNEPSEFEE